MQFEHADLRFMDYFSFCCLLTVRYRTVWSYDGSVTVQILNSLSEKRKKRIPKQSIPTETYFALICGIEASINCFKQKAKSQVSSWLMYLQFSQKTTIRVIWLGDYLLGGNVCLLARINGLKLIRTYYEKKSKPDESKYISRRASIPECMTHSEASTAHQVAIILGVSFPWDSMYVFPIYFGTVLDDVVQEC